MYSPSPQPWAPGETLGEHLDSRGVSRRDFLAFCRDVAIVLGLGAAAGPRVAAALQSQKRPSVIWIQLQECTGCVESLLRTNEPTIGDLVLDVVSLDYNHTLMAAAGHAAESAMHDSMEMNRGEYILIVTGSVPMNEGGIYTMIGGRTAHDVLVEAADGASAVVAVGACAHWGNIQAARPNPTGAVGVSEIVKDKPVLNIAGCPPIGDVITATVVHFLTFGSLPAMDAVGRPRFKGPGTFAPCPIFQWNSGTNWPIGAGHPCLGCTEIGFWDNMTPFYDRLPDVAGFGVERRVDLIGAALALGATAGVAAHAIATGIHQIRNRPHPAADSPAAEPTPTPAPKDSTPPEEDHNG
jgi:hydrogenase small subunit